jgi:hypothetical protein
MKWMEIIELRSLGNTGKQLERQLLEIIDQVDKKGERQTAKLYTRMMIETEVFSIHLLNDTSEFKFEGSELGMRLVSTLKFYGLVNHTIWIEKQKIH